MTELERIKEQLKGNIQYVTSDQARYLISLLDDCFLAMQYYKDLCVHAQNKVVHSQCEFRPVNELLDRVFLNHTEKQLNKEGE